MARQVVQHRIGKRTEAQLQARSIANETRNMLAYLLFHLRRWVGPELVQLPVHFDKMIDLRNVNKAVAQGARHAAVHLGHNDLGRQGRRLGHPHLDAEAAKAVFIRGADDDQGHIQVDDTAPEQPRHFVQMNGHIVGSAFVDGLASIGPHEAVVQAEVPLHVRCDVRRFTQRQVMDDLHILQFFGPVGQRTDQFVGSGTTAAHVDRLARGHILHRFGSGAKTLAKQGHPGHDTPPGSKSARGVAVTPRAAARPGWVIWPA